jgi:hypothetical protein
MNKDIVTREQVGFVVILSWVSMNCNIIIPDLKFEGMVA